MSRVLLAWVIVVMLFSSPTEGKRVRLSVGDEAPEWGNLQGVDGKTHSCEGILKSKKVKAVAVVFSSNECPVARAYVSRLTKLQSDFSEKGFVLIAINPNKGQKENLKAMQAHAKKENFPYAYLRDDRQKVAKKFGALVTPEVFLLNRERKIVYKGAIDDDVKLTGKPKRSYLRDAVEAVLAGKPLQAKSTRAMGCAIRWK